MHRNQNPSRLSRRTLVIGVFCIVAITVLSMHYSSMGITLCAAGHMTLLPPSAPKPVVITKPLLPFANAVDVAHYLQKNNAKIGVELGVQNGQFAQQVLKVWKTPIKYFMVDPYKSQPNYRDFANLGDPAQEKLFKQVKKEFAGYGSVAHIIRKESTAAAAELPNTLDFVYVDARHDYCAVKEDIATYWKKLRVGGIMGGGAYAEEGPPGTDWSICKDGSKHEGAVKRAVDEFVTKKNLFLQVTYADSPLPSWFVQKREADPEDIEEQAKQDATNKDKKGS